MFSGRVIRCQFLFRSFSSSSRPFSTTKIPFNRLSLRQTTPLSRPLSPLSLLSPPPSLLSSPPLSTPFPIRRWCGSGGDSRPFIPPNTPQQEEEVDAKIVASFVCNVCQTRNTHQFSKLTYQQGVVLVRCPGCKNLHLMADNLGWFSDEPDNIEKTLEARGESYQKFLEKGVFEAAVEKQKQEEEENKP